MNGAGREMEEQVACQGSAGVGFGGARSSKSAYVPRLEEIRT